MTQFCRTSKDSQLTKALPESGSALSPIFGGGFSNRVDRSNPRVLVEVEGRELSKVGFAPLISEIEVVEELGSIARASVSLVDADGTFFDDPLWIEGRKLKVSTGYPTTRLARRGTFVVATPMFDFSNSRKIELVAYGEEIKLGRSERRRAFKNCTDSDAAKILAVENGFTADVQATKNKFPQILQANESDGAFLTARAKLYGYEFYVEDGALHFHEPRAQSTGIVLQYRGGNSSTLGRFRVGLTPCFRALGAVATQIDPLSGEVFEARSEERDDPVTKQGLGAATRPTKRWKDLAAAYGGGEKFVVGGGHLGQRGARLPEVEGLARSSRWVVEGSGECQGLEDLRLRRTVTILGVGRWSGEYRVTRVVHRVRPGYRVEFRVSRTWSGTPGASVAPRQSALPDSLTDVSERSELAGIAVEVRP